MHVAEPPDTATAEQIVVAPSLKSTLPLFPGDGDTVAVSVTDWPKTDGFADEPSTVVVVADPGATAIVGWTAMFLNSPGEGPALVCVVNA